MDAIPFPDMLSETLTAHAIDELGTWVEEQIEKGISPITLMGLMELYKTSLAYNLLEDDEEEEEYD